MEGPFAGGIGAVDGRCAPLIYDGEKQFVKGNLSTARDLLLRGMTMYEQLFSKFPVLATDDESLEESITAVYYWQRILKLEFKPIPAQYPLQRRVRQSSDLAPRHREPVQARHGTRLTHRIAARLPAARRRVISSQPELEMSAARRNASIRQACLCARIADEYRGRDTIVLDLTGVTAIFDFFVLTTAGSPRQMRAIADEVQRVLSAEGSKSLGTEGADSATWVLQDYGDIVLHVFTPAARSLYDLEHLWADAVRVDWQGYLDSSKTA